MIISIQVHHLTKKRAYQKVKDTESKQIEGNAHVTMVVEPVKHLYAKTSKKKEENIRG